MVTALNKYCDATIQRPKLIKEHIYRDIQVYFDDNNSMNKKTSGFTSGFWTYIEMDPHHHNLFISFQTGIVILYVFRVHKIKYQVSVLFPLLHVGNEIR